MINDLDFAGYEDFVPMINFAGNINGNGFSISNLNINISDKDLYSTAYYGTFKSNEAT